MDQQTLKTNISEAIRIVWKHPFFVVLCNLGVMMLLYSILRLLCFWINGDMFGHVTFAHLTEMMLGGMRFDLSAILYLSSLYIIGMLLPLPARWRANEKYQQWMKWLLWIPNGIGLIINTIDIAYIPFTDKRTTWTFFTEFQNDTNIGSILGQGLWQYWYIALIVIVLLDIMIIGTRKSYQLISKETAFFYIRQVVILVIAVYFSVIGIRGGFGAYTRPLTISNAMQYADAPRECALILNTPFSMMQTIIPKRFVEPAYYAPNELEQHMSPIHYPDTTQTIRTDNVVVLILESFSKEYIGFYNQDLPDYKGYTPFLDSLLAQSITYQHSYASGRKSIDAMPSILSSIPMLIESYIVTPYSTNAISSIADCLNKKGYYTAFFHGAPNGSMGFQAYARAAGFDRYYGMNEYDGPDAFDGTWAIWDEEFLQYFGRMMDTMPEPFMTTVFTASSHHPFKVPKQYENVFPKGPEIIHEPVGYSDHALRLFFDSIRQMDWYDHTLFVITADHTNMLHLPEYMNDRGVYEVPIAFYHPQLTAQQRTEIISQTDIMPSVLGYLGYDMPYFSFGEDALTRPKTHPYAICYNTTVYQIFDDSTMIQYDGQRITGAYNFRTDRCLQHNLAETIDSTRIAPKMDYLKAYIQQYIHRVIHNQLTVQ